MNPPKKRTSLLRCGAESLGGGLLVSAVAVGIFFANCERTSPPHRKQHSAGPPSPDRAAFSEVVVKEIRQVEIRKSNLAELTLQCCESSGLKPW